MAKTLPTSTANALDSGDVVDRSLIKLELGSGTYGFWTGFGDFTYGGVTYEGAGSLIEVSALPSTVAGTALSVEVRLSAIANTELTNDILATIYDEEYSQKPVVLLTAYFSASTGVLLSVETEFAGYIDAVNYDEEVGGEAMLIGSLESLARDFTRPGFRRRSQADQWTIDPNDGSLRHTSQAAMNKIFWGRATPKESNGGGAQLKHPVTGEVLGRA